MYSFHKIKAAAATLMVGFLLAMAFTATAQAGGEGPSALTSQQLKARARAMDRYYHVGAYSQSAAVLRADKRRAEAIDQYYGLGSHAVVDASNPFQWSDAGIGAGAMLGMVLVVGGLAVVLLRRRGGTSFPSTT